MTCAFGPEDILSFKEPKPTHWSNLILFNATSNNEDWIMRGPFTSDQMLGLASSGLMLLNRLDLDYKYYFIAIDESTATRIILNNIYALDKLGTQG